MNDVGIFFVIEIFSVPFVFVIFLTLIKSQEKQKILQLKADLYAKALENGKELPDSLLELPKKKYNSLRVAIILTFVGIGISAFLFVTNPGNEIKSAAGGLIPLFMGIGFLIIHFILKREGIEDDEE